MILDLSLWNLLRMRIIAEWLACWFSKLWIIGSIPSFFFTNIRLCQLRISSILIMNGRRSYKCPEFTWFAPLKSTASCFKSSQELMKQKGRCPRVKSVRKDGKMTRRGPKGCTTLDGHEDTSGKRKKELWVWDSWKRERERKSRLMFCWWWRGHCGLEIFRCCCCSRKSHFVGHRLEKEKTKKDISKWSRWKS